MPITPPLRLTRKQVREIDRLSSERYHIPGIVLMENASRAVVDVVESMNPAGQVVLLCGGGNNGGDGLAVARHLHNRGHRVTIGLATDPDRYKGDALANWQIVQAMALPTFAATPDSIRQCSAALIIDALFGTGLTDPPRDPFTAIVEAIQSLGVPIVAVDLPSGLDCDTGRPLGACIRATRTVTFVAEKAGFANPQASQWLGQVTVGDIGCPKELIQEVARQSG
jgi:NAD(P)H-hydrate epimerase